MTKKIVTKTFEGEARKGTTQCYIKNDDGMFAIFEEMSNELSDFNRKKVKVEITVKIEEVE